MKGIIYKATNTLNGKVYIGQTISGLEKRKTQHMRGAKIDESNRFHKALYQYPGGFEWEIIDEFSGTRKEVAHFLNVAEEYHIIKNNAYDQDYGYNASIGGYSMDVWDERLQKTAVKHEWQGKKMLQYDKDGNFVKEWVSLSEISREFSKERSGKNNANNLCKGLRYGFQWRVKTSDDFHKKIEPYMLPIKYTPVIVYNTNGELIGRYGSRKGAIEELGSLPKTREEFINIIKLPSGSHVKPRFFCFKDDGGEYPETITVIKPEVKKREKAAPTPSKRVAAYSLDGKLVAVYNSVNEATRATGVERETINRYCEKELDDIVQNPKLKYVWRYVNEFPEKTIYIQPKVRFTYSRTTDSRIVQYSKSGEFIKIWDTTSSAVEAGEDTTWFIRKSLAGENTKHDSKYIWRKYEYCKPMIIAQ